MGVLDQIRESLDNDINAGIGGVRIVISSPYASGAAQQRDTNVKLAMISHGVHYMEDVNGPGIVPGGWLRSWSIYAGQATTCETP